MEAAVFKAAVRSANDGQNKKNNNKKYGKNFRN